MNINLIELLGKDSSSKEVREVINQYGPFDIATIDDETYRSSHKAGLVLVFEDGIIRAVQIKVQAKRKFLPFKGSLPFGIQAMMTQKAVISAIGQPRKSDEVVSWFDFPELHLTLGVLFDDESIVQSLEIRMKP